MFGGEGAVVAGEDLECRRREFGSQAGGEGGLVEEVFEGGARAWECVGDGECLGCSKGERIRGWF